jgi:predicted membrane protein
MRTQNAAVRTTMGLAFGLAVMLAGLLLTLDNFGLLEARRFIRFWPVLLIALGLARLFIWGTSGRRGGTYCLIVLGLGILVFNLGFVSFRQALAIVLLWVGGTIAWRAWRSGHEPISEPTLVLDDSNHLEVFAVMGSIHRGLSAQDFHGGNITAVLGGCELDLTKASIRSGQAVLNTFAFWGGIEIRVPPDWMVETRVIALLGGFADTTRRPDDDRKKLIITGYALMGGVEVVN